MSRGRGWYAQKCAKLRKESVKARAEAQAISAIDGSPFRGGHYVEDMRKQCRDIPVNPHHTQYVYGYASLGTKSVFQGEAEEDARKNGPTRRAIEAVLAKYGY